MAGFHRPKARFPRPTHKRASRDTGCGRTSLLDDGASALIVVLPGTSSLSASLWALVPAFPACSSAGELAQLPRLRSCVGPLSKAKLSDSTPRLCVLRPCRLPLTLQGFSPPPDCWSHWFVCRCYAALFAPGCCQAIPVGGVPLLLLCCVRIGALCAGLMEWNVYFGNHDVNLGLHGCLLWMPFLQQESKRKMPTSIGRWYG